MLKTNVYDMNGKQVGEVDFPGALSAATPPMRPPPPLRQNTSKPPSGTQFRTQPR